MTVTVSDSRCNTKISSLPPERCVVLDGKPCPACIQDIELERQIGELERSIEQLQSKRRAIRTVMNEYHDPFIHKFPPEIASHIFIQYAPPSVSLCRTDRSTPLRLGAVCRKWRQLAWATPQLWSSLVLEFQRAPGEPPLQLISEWLERSAGLPLTIKFYESSKQIQGIYPDVTNILNKHSARWHDIDLNIPRVYFHLLCGSSQETKLSRLTLRNSPISTSLTVFSMKSKPRPTALKLLAVGLHSVDISWNKLTIASLYNLGVDHCIELIRRAPLLQTLRLRSLIFSAHVFPLPNARIVHPHLRVLEISLIKAKDNLSLAGILDSVSFPSLETWDYRACPFILENMLSFIASSSDLKIFKMNIDDIPCHRVTELLAHLSTIEHVELHSALNFTHFLNIELLDMLCSAQCESPLFLPRLQTLDFICECAFPWESLPQLFASPRWRSLKVKINAQSGGHDIVEKTGKVLRELVDQGFDLTIGEIETVREYEDWHRGT